MKNKASVVFKRIMSLLSSIGKVKNRFANTAKARVILFSFMNNKKVLMDSLSHKVQNLLGHRDQDQANDVEDLSKAIVLYNANMDYADQCNIGYDEDYEERYPDLRHSLFDEFDDEDVRDLKAGGSVVDMVRSAKEEGEGFSLEAEIDHVADLFITRFHKQIRLQKLESFKRYQEMMDRSV